MKIQVEYGPDSILPSFMLRHKFNYFVAVQKYEVEMCDDTEANEEKANLDTLEELSTDVSCGKNSTQDPIVENICAICMNDLSVDPSIPYDEKILNKPFIKRLMKMKDKIMRTPCNHEFHIPCLVNWMQIKMECPQCRKELPAL